MKAFFLGDYDPDYIRNDVIISGLKEAGVELINSNVSSKQCCKLLIFAWNYFSRGRKSDVVVVGSSDHSRTIVIMMRLLTIGSKPLVWDAHYSIYDMYVNDRKLTDPNGLKAKYYWMLDRVACLMADVILLDTNAHIDYFVRTFQIPKEKFFRVWVGANPKRLIAKKMSRENDGRFIVSFHGKYIPLQGVKYIIEAANLLAKEPDIYFRLIGSGQTFAESQELAERLMLKNIEFIKRVPYDAIPDLLVSADVSLGIFGSTEKAQKVIANKIYEAIALGVPVITSNTPAIRELFTDRKNVLLCKSADPGDLAEKILLLRDDKTLRATIALNGRNLFNERTTPLLVGKQLVDDILQAFPRLCERLGTRQLFTDKDRI